MGEFANMEEDWSLEAIVRGCTDDHLAMSSSFDHFPDDFLFDHDDTLIFNDFDQLYKPFYRVFDDSLSEQAPIVSSTNYTSSSSSSNDKALKLESEETKMKNSPKSTTLHAVKYKKRKNQHKKVVLQAEGLSSDTWAWRKYGQKPIKGSPYPRSYYKCSSSKGCLARKQVEQSCTDPGMFIITYTAEHNHSQPTRRSSLAGTNRHKFTAHKNSSSGHGSAVATPKSSAGSPTTPLRSSHIEEVAFEKSGCEITNENECQLLTDDFFVGLEDLDSFISESGFYNFPFQSNI